MLFVKLLKSEEDSSYKPARKACVQLVDNLVEHILKYEEALAGTCIKTDALSKNGFEKYRFSVISSKRIHIKRRFLQEMLMCGCDVIRVQSTRA